MQIIKASISTTASLRQHTLKENGPTRAARRPPRGAEGRHIIHAAGAGRPLEVTMTAALLLNTPLTMLLAGLAAAASPAGADTVWLDSMETSKISSGWGRTLANQAVTKRPLSIGGVKFDRGVGTHAPSSAYVSLGGGSARFLASCGVDDGAGAGKGSVVFRVIADGRTIYKSPVLRGGMPPEKIDLDVRGVRILVLKVLDAGDGIDSDHADWAEARFKTTGEAPRLAAGPPKEEPLILTPKPPREPRINGPKIYGCRPGSPLLYRIPATGDRPMAFAAAGLPEGLRLDERSGIITGSIAERGRYAVTLSASNAHGRAERAFTIACGDTLALTPYMGWNSWYIWENRVTERHLREAADAMVSTGMADVGFSYVCIDDCWMVKPGSKDPELGGPPRDAEGRILPNKRFPDIKGMVDYIHSKGLKAGIYTSPGPLTCAGFEGAYQHEEIDARTFAEWGFDLLKYDWCSYSRVARNKSDLETLQKPYRLMSGILRRQKRDIILNLCQYGMGEVWKWGKEVGGHSWRTAGDLGLTFEGIAAGLFRDGFDLYSRRNLHEHAGPGGWNDPDYLLLGYLSNWRGQTAPAPLTPNEQYTHVSLWCLVASPLILSGDITRLDEFTVSLLTNAEVIEVNQDSLGKPGRRVAQDADAETEVWMKEMEDGSKAVGLFNRGEGEAVVTALWTDLGVSGPQLVRDLWRQKDLGVFEDRFSSPVPRHGTVLARIRPAGKERR